MRWLAKEGACVTANRWIPALMLIASLCGATVADAQSVTPVERVQPDGTVASPLALTQAQRGVIYSGVKQQRVHSAADGVATSVGAPVAPLLALSDAPDVPALADGEGDFLKYATVEGDVVVVDPIRMRVVEVIHPGAVP